MNELPRQQSGVTQTMDLLIGNTISRLLFSANHTRLLLAGGGLAAGGLISFLMYRARTWILDSRLDHHA